MNKIYKVVWNKARNCYVVASEFAKNQGKASSAKRILAVLVAAGSIGGTISGVQAANNITETKTPPQMIGYKQKWDTDVKNGKLGTSIDGWQYQGNSLQLNFLKFEKYTTQKGENGLAIRLGAYVDGINKSGNLYFVDTNTKTSVSVDGNFNLNTTTDDETNVTNYGISLKDSVTIGGTHAVTINGTDGTVTGLTNTTWNKDSITSGRAATEDQLQAVATEAGKHTTLSNGKNTTVNPVTTADGHLEYKVDVNDELKDIKSIIGAGEGAGSISFANDGIKFNNKVTIDNTGKISGVANGIADNDAVNVSQLNKVSAAAKTEVVKGTNIASVVASNATDDGHTVYTVNAKGTSVSVDGNFNLNTTTDDETNVTNYGISLKDSVTIGGTHAVTINGTDGTITGLTNTTWNKDSITSGRAATEDQLQAVATEAGKHTTLSNGKNTTVNPVTTADGHLEYKVDVNDELKDIKSIIGAGEGAGSISFADGGIKLNNKVTINKDGKITGVAAGAITETSTDAVNGSQLHAVATEAGKHTTLSNGKNTTVNPVTTADGHLEYKVDVNDELKDIKSIIGAGEGAGSISFADGGIKLNNKVTINKDGKITGVAAGVEKTDAVNVGQLTDYVAANDTHIKSGNYAVGEVTDSTGNKSQGVSMDIVNKEGKVTGTVTITDVAKASDVGEVNNIDSDIKNQNGSHTTVVDAVNNLNQKLDTKVGDLQYSKVEKGDIADGDSTTTAIGKLDQKLTDVAATAAKHTKVEGSSNIIVTNTAKEGEAANYKVELNKDIDVDTVKATTVTTGQTVMNNDGLKVGKDVSVTATAVTAGQTSISNDGLKVNGKTYVSDSGLNANDQKITNVADGKVEKGSTDAVNGGQLYNETRVAKDGNFVKKSNTAGENLSALDNQVTANTESIYHMNGRISDLDNRVNKVGAGAAALAALHPLDFDPDAKWDFAAGYGNYRGANAAAVGAYYRPNEDTMFSVGGTFGNGENMVNADVSFKLGSGSSHVSTSRVAMAKEIKELRGELEAMKSAMLDANAGKKIDTSKLQLFPDVPQNHWAYEYVAQLAGNGMIEGYPDGNFAGDRPMTRYEFAAILYRAMTKGAVLSDKILSEFSHELEYFTVDTIAKDKAGNPTIQRVRIVKENKNK
ncbi:ESPR-type extended signal peptide-containing protein [Mitsuokella jalaludinii]|uniref:ESPR-type extended signal peptide-containing protein n=1 Tax=Mitsuokella jalaludinii TaxID=187979 RepID=UPI003119F685